MLKPTVLGKNIIDTQTDVFKESNQQWLLQFKQKHQKLDGNRTRNSILPESQKLGSLYSKVRSGGEPDLVHCDVLTQGLIFMDFSAESPAGRRSLCFNQKAMDGRNENKSRVSTLTMAEAMEISTLTEQEYQRVQNLEPLDTKTSSWWLTSLQILKEGDSVYRDLRYDQVLTYHNGASYYYFARGFRISFKH